METTPIFNLNLTYEEALADAKAFQSKHKTADDGKELRIWDNPMNFYGKVMKFPLDGIYAESFDADIAEMYQVGKIDAEAKAALRWLMKRYDGFNELELGQIIVGTQSGIEDHEVAIFTYLSKEDDCLRDFIIEKAFQLVNK